VKLSGAGVYIQNNALHVDIGRGSAVALPPEEMQFRWKSTTPQWPIMSAVLHGVSRDQLIARHKANHFQVVYAPSAEMADKALAAKAVMFAELGLAVHLCGDAKYQKRITGPLLDRIDIYIEVPRVDYEKLSSDRMGESSEAIRARVQAARNIQQARFETLEMRILSATPICGSGRSGSFASCRMKVRV